MKIYLLLIDHERFFFYSDESESSHDEGDGDGPSAGARPGVRGWLHDRYLRFKSAWQQSDSGALFWMRRSWDWLHSLAHPDEAMLARLRSARRIDLHHPAAQPGATVCAIWHDYLTRQWRRHLLWMSVNAVIAPFTVIFAILPGPNLIGYWFAYRAIHHVLVSGESDGCGATRSRPSCIRWRRSIYRSNTTRRVRRDTPHSTARPRVSTCTWRDAASRPTRPGMPALPRRG